MVAHESRREGRDFVSCIRCHGSVGPQEATRIAGEAIDFARRGQLSLRPLNAGKPGKSR
jgi:hypothetical protein